MYAHAGRDMTHTSHTFFYVVMAANLGLKTKMPLIVNARNQAPGGTLANIQKPSKIKDIGHQIQKICTVIHAVPECIHGEWGIMNGSCV